MLHTYRKTATIQAEQFDGNLKMQEKYGIDLVDFGIDDYRYVLSTKEGDMVLTKGDWIATGIDGEHWAIAPDIFEKTYERCD